MASLRRNRTTDNDNDNNNHNTNINSATSTSHRPNAIPEVVEDNVWNFEKGFAVALPSVMYNAMRLGIPSANNNSNNTTASMVLISTLDQC